MGTGFSKQKRKRKRQNKRKTKYIVNEASAELEDETTEYDSKETIRITDLQLNISTYSQLLVENDQCGDPPSSIDNKDPDDSYQNKLSNSVAEAICFEQLNTRNPHLKQSRNSDCTSNDSIHTQFNFLHKTDKNGNISDQFSNHAIAFKSKLPKGSNTMPISEGGPGILREEHNEISCEEMHNTIRRSFEKSDGVRNEIMKYDNKNAKSVCASLTYTTKCTHQGNVNDKCGNSPSSTDNPYLGNRLHGQTNPNIKVELTEQKVNVVPVTNSGTQSKTTHVASTLPKTHLSENLSSQSKRSNSMAEAHTFQQLKGSNLYPEQPRNSDCTSNDSINTNSNSLQNSTVKHSTHERHKTSVPICEKNSSIPDHLSKCDKVVVKKERYGTEKLDLNILSGQPNAKRIANSTSFSKTRDFWENQGKLTKENRLSLQKPRCPKPKVSNKIKCHDMGTCTEPVTGIIANHRTIQRECSTVIEGKESEILQLSNQSVLGASPRDTYATKNKSKQPSGNKLNSEKKINCEKQLPNSQGLPQVTTEKKFIRNTETLGARPKDCITENKSKQTLNLEKKVKSERQFKTAKTLAQNKINTEKKLLANIETLGARPKDTCATILRSKQTLNSDKKVQPERRLQNPKVLRQNHITTERKLRGNTETLGARPKETWATENKSKQNPVNMFNLDKREKSDRQLQHSQGIPANQITEEIIRDPRVTCASKGPFVHDVIRDLHEKIADLGKDLVRAVVYDQLSTVERVLKHETELAIADHVNELTTQSEMQLSKAKKETSERSTSHEDEDNKK